MPSTTYTATIAFFGTNKPLVFQANSLDLLCKVVESATFRTQDAKYISERMAYLCGEIAKGYSRASSETSALSVSIKPEPHDNWIDKYTKDLPPYLFADYSLCGTIHE
jgi:hypothetical protein